MNEGEKNKIKKERSKFLSFLLAFFFRDFWVIILCLLVLIACAYTIGRSADIQNKCNERWIKQLGLDQMQDAGNNYEFPDLNNLNLSSFESVDT